jgi:hypothetical protein
VKMENEYSWEYAGERLESLYREVLGARSSGPKRAEAAPREPVGARSSER